MMFFGTGFSAARSTHRHRRPFFQNGSIFRLRLQQFLLLKFCLSDRIYPADGIQTNILLDQITGLSLTKGRLLMKNFFIALALSALAAVSASAQGFVVFTAGVTTATDRK